MKTFITVPNPINSVDSLYKEYWDLTSVETLLAGEKVANQEQYKANYEAKFKSIFERAEKFSDVDQIKLMLMIKNTSMPHFKRDKK